MQRRVRQRRSSAARQQLSVVPASRDASLLHQADSFAFSAFEEGIDQSISICCLDSSVDCGGDVCQVEAAEHRVGLFSQLLLDMGSIAVKATLPEICRCVCQAGDTCLAMLSCRADRFGEAIRACMRLLLAGVDRAFAHGSPRVQSALADSCLA